MFWAGIGTATCIGARTLFMSGGTLGGRSARARRRGSSCIAGEATTHVALQRRGWMGGEIHCRLGRWRSIYDSFPRGGEAAFL